MVTGCIFLGLWWVCGFATALYNSKKDRAYIESDDVLMCMVAGIAGPLLLIANLIAWALKK